MQKLINFFIPLVLGFVVGITIGVTIIPTQVSVQLNKPNNETNLVVEQKISLLIDFGNDFKYYPNINFSENKTVLEILKSTMLENNLEFVTKDYEGIGTMIQQIDDKINGQDNKYWQYWVGNEQPQVGADKYIVSNNDLIIWKFVESQY